MVLRNLVSFYILLDLFQNIIRHFYNYVSKKQLLFIYIRWFTGTLGLRNVCFIKPYTSAILGLASWLLSIARNSSFSVYASIVCVHVHACEPAQPVVRASVKQLKGCGFWCYCFLELETLFTLLHPVLPATKLYKLVPGTNCNFTVKIWVCLQNPKSTH